MKYAHLLIEAASTPWAMEPIKLHAMLAILRFAIDGGKHSQAEINARLDAAKIHPNTDRSIANKDGAIAVIGLRGVMSNRAALVDDVSTGRGTNMDAFGRAFRTAMSSDQVKAIIIDVDSPGGSVFGVDELASEIRAARGKKPMVAQVNASAFSAAYWLASACDEIVLTPSGQVGSIGVFTVHEDISKMLAKEGIKETIISAGKYKTEGNPFEPLDTEAKKAMQAMVDEYHARFLQAVADGRGVRAGDVERSFGQGRCVTAQAALSAGMVDRLGTMQDTLARWGVRGTGSPANNNSRAQAHTPRLNLALRKQALIESL